MNATEAVAIAGNSEASEGVATSAPPLDTPPKPSDSDPSDECETNEACIMHDDLGVDVGTLLGPSNVPAPLHDAPRTSAGEVDWIKLAALVRAVESLVGAGLGGHAKPLIVELRSIIEGAMPKGAEVIALNARPR